MPNTGADTDTALINHAQTLSLKLASLLKSMNGAGHESFCALDDLDKHNLIWLAQGLAEDLVETTWGIVGNDSQ